MGFWNHLIMNHLMLANHASWARWLKRRSPELWIEQQICWKSYIQMYVVRWILRLVAGIIIFLTFTDDLSRYGYIYLMKHKSETFEKFKEFQSEVENHRDEKIRFLWFDRGDKYLSYEFGLQLKQSGIVSQNSRHLEHHSIMVCPNIINVLYWI